MSEIQGKSEDITLAQYMYRYAKEYFLHDLKITLMMENWFGKDIAPKYVEFMQKYISIKSDFSSQTLTKEQVTQEFKKLRVKELEKACRLIYKDMVERFEKARGSISPKQKTALQGILSKYISLGEVNFDFIMDLREFEETNY